MSAGVRESLSKAQAAADQAYAKWLETVHEDTVKWGEFGYSTTKSKILSIESLKTLAKDNWGKLAIIGAAFGVPVATSDTGAFGTVFGLLKTLLPIF